MTIIGASGKNDPKRSGSVGLSSRPWHKQMEATMNVWMSMNLVEEWSDMKRYDKSEKRHGQRKIRLYQIKNHFYLSIKNSKEPRLYVWKVLWANV